LRGIGGHENSAAPRFETSSQIFGVAFLFNVIGIPIAAGVFYPIFGWLLSPMLASAAMSSAPFP